MRSIGFCRIASDNAAGALLSSGTAGQTNVCERDTAMRAGFVRAAARCACVGGGPAFDYEIGLQGVGLPVLPYSVIAEIIVAQPCPCEKFTVIMPFTPNSLATSPQKTRVSARPFCGAGRRNVTTVTGEP